MDDPEDKFLTIGSLQVTVQLEASRPCEGIDRGIEVPPEEEFSQGYERWLVSLKTVAAAACCNSNLSDEERAILSLDPTGDSPVKVA